MHDVPGDRRRPGSAGEHMLQRVLGSTHRADRFYDTQVTSRLTAQMQNFISRMEMVFIATSDAAGECDCSFRAGPPGFTRVIGDSAIAMPDYRGNGVMASLGNILENPHVGLFFVDFTQDLIGLHVNGRAHIATPERMQEVDPCVPWAGEPDDHPGRRPEQWIVTEVEEAYIHCSKHIPKLLPQLRVRHWGTDNPRYKGGDYFGVGEQSAAAGDL